MSKEAMKLALEALEAMQSYAAAERKGLRICDEAITALREALAQQPAQQEPIKQGWDVDTLLDKPIPLKDFYEPAQQQEPEYAWPTVADYERDVGFQTNEAFRIAWNMARTTNRMLGHTSSQPAHRTWVGLTEQEALDCFSPNPVTHSKNVEAKLKERNT